MLSLGRSPSPDIWAPLPPMRDLVETLDKVADKDVTVVLTGESGTGKERLARRVHERSPRRDGPFVAVNCASMPESGVEVELFGHEPGAFPGADRVVGKIEAAEGGTLFLDDLGELSLTAQARLLRYLEVRRYTRVGGHHKVASDVRLVCANLRPLEDDVRGGRLRPDLYYRVQGITLAVPPLRERRGDLAPLVDQFTASSCARHSVPAPRYTREARAALSRYAWPGNVRELRNVIEAVCLLRSGRAVRLSDLPLHLQGPAEAVATLTLPLDRTLDELEARILHAVLDAEGGHQRRTAERLGISVRTLQRRLSVDPTDEDPDTAGG